jgi:hypothetical protein
MTIFFVSRVQKSPSDGRAHTSLASCVAVKLLTPAAMTTKEEPLVAILTLKQHKDGIWITKLVEAFPKTVKVVILSLESSLLDGLNPGAAKLFPSNTLLLINRVSDAAPPHLVKACTGILQLATSIYKIRVWNGPTSYSLCSNKWCQHVLFSRAHLKSPSTQVLLDATPESIQDAVNVVKDNGSVSVLLKPNAGGFGSGVKRIESTTNRNVSADESLLLDETIPNYADKVTLIQKYVKADTVYRVWFLCGKVQCGIERINNTGADEFTSACLSDVCTRQQATDIVRAYKVPDDVLEELEEKLLPLLPDAHSGSVEFLYNEHGDRLYFDLNLLSTLPLVEQNDKSLWENNYDPWKEMANAMVKMIVPL